MAFHLFHGVSHVITSIDPEMRECQQLCADCHRVCLETITGYCLLRGGVHAEPHHLTMMMDCAQICQTSADFLSRGSPNHGVTCHACAQLCELCADDCERLDDE